ncbi:MAG: hypothetical protein C5S38_00205 [Candidatus Methanophagaceae archaeon]|nr:MAG: hypothetical protein C5S38_00205 [Methanophagales archaeon]KAF5430557.1 Flp pilus assembly protein [Methanophagales archaeon]
MLQPLLRSLLGFVYFVDYDKAIELNPEFGDTWNNKGVNLEKLGRKDEAEHCFQKAKELGYEAS